MNTGSPRIDARRSVDRHPDQTFVPDPPGKPRVLPVLLDSWRREVLERAPRPIVFCRLPRPRTEAAWDGWPADDLRPSVQTALESFGPGRLMFGSACPVRRLACGCLKRPENLAGFFNRRSVAEQPCIWRRTAGAAYAHDEPVADTAARGGRQA